MTPPLRQKRFLVWGNTLQSFSVSLYIIYTYALYHFTTGFNSEKTKESTKVSVVLVIYLKMDRQTDKQIFERIRSISKITKSTLKSAVDIILECIRYGSNKKEWKLMSDYKISFIICSNFIYENEALWECWLQIYLILCLKHRNFFEARLLGFRKGTNNKEKLSYRIEQLSATKIQAVRS